jgi:16S rRNA (guanine(966)-N(2))-methyltransferase RsmD
LSANELRLSGGELRGRRLRVPRGVRPTEGRVREALFSIWQGEVTGSRFLDLFAGSGAVGLEALGRGAVTVVLVEGDPRVHRELRANLAAVAAPATAHAYRLRLPAGIDVLRAREAPFDLVFADPPYGYAEGERLLAAAAPLLAPGGALCWEHSRRDQPPVAAAGLLADGTREYGETALSLYRRAS